MSNLTSLLTLHQPADKTVAWTIQRLIACGFQVERTFDLHAARMSQVDCPCPYHGTSDCTCQMVVLLVHSQKAQPATIVAHGHDGQTSLSLVDMASQSMDEGIIQALLPVGKILRFDHKETKMAKDPVCGMDVDPKTATGKSEYKGQTYYFCCPGCKASFDKDPEKYLSSHQEAHHH